MVLGGGCFAYGFLSHRNHLPPYEVIARAMDGLRRFRRMPAGDVGSWNEVTAPGQHERRFQGAEASRVLNLPYVAAYEPASQSGVRQPSPAKAWPGFNFYVSGHASVCVLVDMGGQFVHEWRIDARVLGRPDSRPALLTAAFPLPGGDVLAILDDTALVRVDWDSRVKWMRAGRFHHFADVKADGSVVAIARKEVRLPQINDRRDVLEDYAVYLTPEGIVTSEFSLLSAVENSHYASLLANVDRWGDLFHTNSLRVLDGTLADKLPVLAAGNLLLSIPRLNAVVVVDPQLRRAVWALAGMFTTQHDAQFLPSGELLLFDNWGRQGASRIVEIDPLTQSIIWEYPPPGGDLFSACCGTVQRLPNGNTLVTESTRGRAREITRQGETVWQFDNPARGGEGGRLVATLFRLHRFDPSFFPAAPAGRVTASAAPARPR